MLALLLSASLLGSIHDSIYQELTDSMDTSRKAERVQFAGEEILFQHQLWHIDPQSVCANHERYSTAHSQCSAAASRYFSDSCRYLSDHPADDHLAKQVQSMLCQASLTFKPTVAQISAPPPKSRLQKLESQCNQLILQATSTGDAAIAEQRDAVCAQFRALDEQ